MRACPWCKARGFFTTIYKKIINQHQPCPHPGCGFIWQG
jgi:hypothetical protein